MSSGPVDNIAPQAAKSVDVALAEFTALRAEIVSVSTAQRALVGIGLTALGAIFGFALNAKGNEHLLLAVPPLAALLSLLHAGESARAASIGAYIRDNLWRHIRHQVGTGQPSWEEHKAERRRSWTSVPRAIVIDGAATALFALASVAALWMGYDRSSLLWRADGVVTLVGVVVPIGIAFATRKDWAGTGSPGSSSPNP